MVAMVTRIISSDISDFVSDIGDILSSAGAEKLLSNKLETAIVNLKLSTK